MKEVGEIELAIQGQTEEIEQLGTSHLKLRRISTP